MVGLQRESRSFHDLDGVQQALGGFFPALQYGGVDRSRVHVRMEVATADRFSFVDSAWGVPGTAITGSSDLTVVASGGHAYRLSHGRNEIDHRQPFLAPAEGLEATWETHHASILVLDLAAVEGVARAASGDASLRLRRTGTAPSSPELAGECEVQAARRDEHGRRDIRDRDGLARVGVHEVDGTAHHRRAAAPALGVLEPVGRERVQECRREVAEGRLRAVSYTHLTLPTICSV